MVAVIHAESGIYPTFYLELSGAKICLEHCVSPDAPTTLLRSFGPLKTELCGLHPSAPFHSELGQWKEISRRFPSPVIGPRGGTKFLPDIRTRLSLTTPLFIETFFM